MLLLLVKTNLISYMKLNSEKSVTVLTTFFHLFLALFIGHPNIKPFYHDCISCCNLVQEQLLSHSFRVDKNLSKKCQSSRFKTRNEMLIHRSLLRLYRLKRNQQRQPSSLTKHASSNNNREENLHLEGVYSHVYIFNQTIQGRVISTNPSQCLYCILM